MARPHRHVLEPPQVSIQCLTARWGGGMVIETLSMKSADVWRFNASAAGRVSTALDVVPSVLAIETAGTGRSCARNVPSAVAIVASAIAPEVSTITKSDPM